MRKTGTVLFLFVVSTIRLNASCKDYHEYNFPFFTGRQPSAKSEAMGRTLVASSDGAFTDFYNPAAMIRDKGLNAAFSYASPYYLASKAGYDYIGMTYNLNQFGALGFSRFHFSLGSDVYETDVLNPDGSLKSDVPTTTFYTLGYAVEILRDFSVGFNLNLYDNDLGSRNVHSWPVDVGLLKTLTINREKWNQQSLILGASVKNVFSTETNKDGFLTREALPVILRAGASYELSLLKQAYLPNLFIIGLTVQSEYEKILNAKYQAGVKFGAELTFFEIVFARFGYYSYSQDPSTKNGKKSLSDLTYGFGVQLPVDELLAQRVPLTLCFDLTNLRQPSNVTDFNDWGHFSTYALKMNWAL